MSLAAAFEFFSFLAMGLASIIPDIAGFLVSPLEAVTFFVLGVTTGFAIAPLFAADLAPTVSGADDLLARGIAADSVAAALFFTLAAMINLFIGKGK